MAEKVQLPLHTEDDRVDENGYLVVQLPGGFVDESEGIIVREVAIDEMDGRAEEILADPRFANAPAKGISAFLAYLIKTIGGQAGVSASDVSKMLSGDRDFLMVKARVHGFGTSQWDTEVQCPKCKDITPITIDLNKLKVYRLPDDHPREVTGTLDRGFRDKTGKIHKDYTMRLPTGEDQEAVGRQKNASRMKSQIMVRCLEKLGTLKKITDVEVRNMKWRERQELEASLYSNTPGMNWTVPMTCSCGNEWDAVLDVSSLFRAEQDHGGDSE